MTSITGKYQHYKNEDIDDYFIAVGVPFIGRKMMAMSSPLMEITLDGENMTIKNSSLLRTVELSFKFGEEYEEKMPSTTIKSITTLVNENQISTQSVIPETGEKCARLYKFTDEECIINDGCPAHYGINVLAYLNATHRNKWIGHLGPILWPLRSPI